jgi:hypothetical protein
MAGRDISVTHEALGAVRVMRTGGMMGEVVGMAAAVCKRRECQPRGVYEKHLDDLKELMTRGVGKNPVVTADASAREPVAPPKPPEWLKTAGPNLARTAKVRVSGSQDAKQSPLALINDGRIDLGDNRQRWLSDKRTPQHIEFAWDKPQSISAVRVVSGYREGSGRLVGAIEDFSLQYQDGGQWKDVPGTKADGNGRVDWHARFEPVTSARLRLLITATPSDTARIWEVELYGAARPGE